MTVALPKPKPKKRRDPLLDAADALEAGHLTHEQLRAMNTPEAVAQGYQEDTDLGPWLAAGLGAARGASFGLGDLAQKLTLNPSERAAVQTTGSQHPYATAAGTAVGAALPFLLAPSLTGAAVGRGAAAGIGAAQGAGLTPGGPEERAVGGLLGAGTAFAAPYLAKGAGAAAGKLPLVGPLLKRAAGVQAGFPVALKAAAGTPEEIAVAAKLGLPLEAVRGRVGQAAITAQARPGLLTPSAPPPIDPLETAPALRGSQLSQLGRGERLPYYPRGGQAEQALAPPPIQSPPVIGPASPEVVARSASHAQLMQALGNPQTSLRIRQVILGELQRRGIVGPGLLTPLLQ